MIPQEIKDAGLANVYKIVILVGICLILSIIGIISALILGDDNPLEQEVELMIFQNSGYMVDLTPGEK